jgi:anti-sigma28 factor (negative regulator of flagellin synthesis)
MVDKFRPLTDKEKQYNESEIKRVEEEIRVRQNYVEVLKEEIKNGTWFNDNMQEALEWVEKVHSKS